MTGGQRTGDPAGPQVAFFVAAHVPERSLMLVPQQSEVPTMIIWSVRVGIQVLNLPGTPASGRT
jgi:hypothetical protein